MTVTGWVPFHERPREGLGGRQSDQQRPHQPRAMGHGDRIQIRQPQPGLLQCLAEHREDVLDVRAAGDLRHNAAILGVNLHLRGDDAGAHVMPIHHDRRRCFVTRRFNSEDSRHGEVC